MAIMKMEMQYVNGTMPVGYIEPWFFGSTRRKNKT